MTATEHHAGLDHILRHIDLATMRGLEIGPLFNPIVEKGEGVDVRYVDHADTETLQRKYADDPNVPFVLDVDIVWDRPLTESVGRGTCDYVIASHVMEHVPDLVSWLRELGDVLRPGGVLSLVIPDKRYCFDARRRPTDVSEIIEAHLTHRRRPSLAQIFDFDARYVDVDTLAIWAGRPGHADPPPRWREAYQKCVDAMAHDDYVDVHATTWTPAALVDTLRVLFELDLVPFAVASFCPTPFNSLEFYASLERLPDDLGGAERRARQLGSLPNSVDGDEPLQPTPPPRPTAAPGRTLVDVSDKEQRLIDAKRRAFGVVRSAVNRVRRAARSPRPQG